jgi:hypothetical protein
MAARDGKKEEAHRTIGEADPSKEIRWHDPKYD